MTKPTLAVEVDGMMDKRRRDELDLAHGAGPGSLHGLGRNVALVDDAQGVQKLRPKEGAAPAVVGQGCERGDHRKAAGVVAEVALEPP